MLAMIGTLAGRFVQTGSRCYDLGCSLGAATFAIRDSVPAGTTIFAVDNSAAMLRRLREHLKAEKPELAADRKIEVVEADICDINIQQASFVVMNLTLQFIALEKRKALLEQVYRGLVPGGVLLISEKISGDEPAKNELLSELHHDFKRANGYSDLEISQKRTALENTLIPETLEQHQNRLVAAGFSTVIPWFQCFNFASVLAFREGAAQ